MLWEIFCAVSLLILGLYAFPCTEYSIYRLDHLPMPGYEVIGEEEKAEILDLFDNGAILFRHGFDSLRNNCYKVRDFESSFAHALGSKYALAVSSGTAALRVSLAALGIGAW